MNKRGFLLGEETVKIIIAVICLAALVYFLVSLYIANQNKDLELAKASLEKLIIDINAGRMETEIYNPNGWGIVSFSSSRGIIPDFCSNAGWMDCICICNSYKTHSGFDCSNKNNAVCKESDFVVGGSSSISGPNVIPISPAPLLLSINKNDKTISKRE